MAKEQLIFMACWTGGMAIFAGLCFWRLRDGLKNRRFWHPFYRVFEDANPTWFMLEKVMTIMLLAMSTLFLAIGIFVLFGLLLGNFA